MIARLPGLAIGTAIAAILVTTGRPVTGGLAALSVVFAVAATRWTGCATPSAASAIAGLTADQLPPSPRLTTGPTVVLAVLLTAYLLIADGPFIRPRTWAPALAAITAIAITVAATALHLPAPAVVAGLAAVSATAIVAVHPLHHTENHGHHS
ncbi:hypothetical protein [Mangrovihabitans endophyticus]|uniref:Uncharacterized protein n=1 Tax=Mangrovihabitans endophyticus TaxID=1751298 RepID=A0A8J3BXR1_9ACTN|nr:hypothetical protein [Mangrovihabitans endophyticus]GGK79852.1 hypothetical protein GCM10012284_12340 [Mangrovihabitans endophyticus]